MRLLVPNFEGKVWVEKFGEQIKIQAISKDGHKRLTRIFYGCSTSEAVEAFIIIWENLYED